MTRNSDSTVTLTRSECALLEAAMVRYQAAVDSDFTITNDYSDAVAAAEMDITCYPILPSEPIDADTILIWYSAINYYMDTVARTPAAVALSGALWPYII